MSWFLIFKNYITDLLFSDEQDTTKIIISRASGIILKVIFFLKESKWNLSNHENK